MNADVRGAWAVHSDVLDWLTASGSTEKIRKQSLLYRQQSDVSLAAFCGNYHAHFRLLMA